MRTTTRLMLGATLLMISAVDSRAQFFQLRFPSATLHTVLLMGLTATPHLCVCPAAAQDVAASAVAGQPMPPEASAKAGSPLPVLVERPARGLAVSNWSGAEIFSAADETLLATFDLPNEER